MTQKGICCSGKVRDGKTLREIRLSLEKKKTAAKNTGCNKTFRGKRLRKELRG